VLAPLFAIRERFQRPIWCGETASHNPTILRTMLDLLEENDCSWTLWAYKDVGTMGLVFPGPETPWRRFVARFPGRGEDRRIASEIAAFMTERGLGPLGNVDFRLRAIVHRLWVDNLVAPALSETPWDDVRTLPESFALSQCQRQDEILAIVRAYARR
jgi:hypothetical protein